MKTLQELHDEVAASAELREAFSAAAKSGRIVEFARENGCDAPDEELAAFAASYETGTETKALSVDELDNVAGGNCDDYDNCNHRGKSGGLEGGYKKDYTNNYWYQRDQCGYCKKRITAVIR
ncbi:MAG: hypothetical protein IJK28_02885 [Clostridia bacterium]|nr:hypothetical protein [Clostridia bacterium]